MRVLHFSTADIEGGSARSAYRIHSALRSMGHVSHMLVGQRASNDPDVGTTHGGGWRKNRDLRISAALNRLGLQYQWLPSGRRVLAHRWLAAADIVQLYNTHGGYLSHRLLPKLSARAPIVWRFSDMWPITGHCAYSGGCERWQKGCGECPDLGTYPAIGCDTTGWLWWQKRELYAKSRLTIVAPSSWTERLANSSPLLAGSRVHRIPNGLDLETFRPVPRAFARKTLGLPLDGRLLFFSAHVAADNHRKGTDILKHALHIGAMRDVTLVVAGKECASWEGKVPQRVVPLGWLDDDRKIALANAAADFSVTAAPNENLPNTVLESIACGTPVVAVAAGGVGDAVRHGETGFLAAAASGESLAAALTEAFAHADPAALRQRAVALARAEYDSKLEAQRFVGLYRELLEDTVPNTRRYCAS
jgi:glycosyltransferase involved in cell wall biosynthesis